MRSVAGGNTVASSALRSTRNIEFIVLRSGRANLPAPPLSTRRTYPSTGSILPCVRFFFSSLR
jgi:hypothetical protein